MKIAIGSDLHLEFEDFNPINEEGADVLILAGDIFIACAGLALQHRQEVFIKRACENFKYVIYIMGNHEYYHSYFNHAKPLIEMFTSDVYDNFFFLDDSQLTLEGQHFIGSTLWTDQDGLNPTAIEGSRMMADFNGIIKEFTVEQSVHKFDKASTYIMQALKPGSIVITHHSPSFKSCHPKYAKSIVNPSFHSDLDWFMEFRDPKLWIHGHIHDVCDYYIENTRVICNPKGYPKERSWMPYSFKYLEV